MYKLKKSRKKTNKRFSRNTKTKTKTKINRQYKTRKIRGGNKYDNGFTLVGFVKDGPIFSPVFLFNNLEYKLDSRDKLSSLGIIDMTGRYSSHIILPQLYKLKKIRGLNLYSMLGHNAFKFYDEYGNVLIDGTFLNPTNISYQQHWEGRPDKDKPRYRDTIREIELKYPGLFRRMYVTAEEEQESLKVIEEKEKEEQEEETLTSAKNEEIQEMKRVLQEIQRKLNEKEEDNQMKEISAREMEATEGMIPYLREEAKAKKHEKAARKKYYNTYFQNDF